MPKISKNFSREEFACKCGCGMDTVDAHLITVLEDVRTYFNKPVTVTSGNRCVAHNRLVGGENFSKHLISRAADIKVKDVHPEDVYTYLDMKYDDLGLGLYSGWVHVDSREQKARW